MLSPKVIFDFPIQPWNPGDPIIRDGIEHVLGGKLSGLTPYGGCESYRDADLARQLAHTHDSLLVAGTPAFWDPCDRDIFRAAMDNHVPIVIWGIGCGGSDRMWEGLNQERDLLERLATYPDLQCLVFRDETTHQVFRHAGAASGQVQVCPGLFALPETKVRTAKSVVALDIVDPATLEKDGLFDAWTYYAQIKHLIDKLLARGANLRLGCQRSLFGTGQEPFSLLRPSAWLDGTGRSLMAWLDDLGVPRVLIENLVDFPTREAFRAHYAACDVYIGGRIHGALPCIGSGIPALGIGIDMRRHTWQPAASVLAIAPFQPPLIDIDFILDWYDRLEPEAASNQAIRFRSQALHRTRHLLRMTFLAPFIPSDTDDDDASMSGRGNPIAALIKTTPSPPVTRDVLLSDQPIRRPPPCDLRPVFHPDDRIYFQDSRHFAEARVYNWYFAYGQALRPKHILEIGVRRGYGAHCLISGASGSVLAYTGIDMELDLPGSNAATEAMIRRLGQLDITLLKANTLTEFPALSGPFDLIHIDGDHSTRGALLDLVNCLPLLADNGVIIIDDVESAPVAAAIELARAALGKAVRFVERGDWHRQVLIVAQGKAPELSMSDVLGVASLSMAARLRFDESRLALRLLLGHPVQVSEIAVHFLRITSAITTMLDPGKKTMEFPASGSTVDIFSAFATLIEHGSQLAQVKGLANQSFRDEALEHGTYALRYLSDFEPPPLFGTILVGQSTLQPETPTYAQVLLEASMNFTEILLRMEMLLAPKDEAQQTNTTLS